MGILQRSFIEVTPITEHSIKLDEEKLRNKTSEIRMMMKTLSVVAILASILVVSEAAECPDIPEGGAFSIDGCNRCGCSEGKVTFCTMMACPEDFCFIDYWKDPCNFCRCIDGVGVCTEIGCLEHW